ncbi:MAG: hypothetical protein R8G66_34055 [Cytophagales bacterium]|nr:hypothetical protein [Cytophagales bacterium]
MTRKHFLLSKTPIEHHSGKVVTISDYYLHLGSELEHTHVDHARIGIHLIGDIFDWLQPEKTNEELLSVLKAQSLEQLILEFDQFSGEFIVIFQIDEKIFLFNDACGQKEVYYDADFQAFGSQPSLLGLVADLRKHEASSSAQDFYTSKTFNRNLLFVGNSTQFQNVVHLTPNHYIDVHQKEINRFFPLEKLKSRTLQEGASQAAKMIRGYVEAVATRKPSKIAVTGGYDSRVLFLASLNSDNCEYFVFRHKGMSDQHHDIKIPRELTTAFQKEFDVIDDLETYEVTTDYKDHIDFPRYPKIDINDVDRSFINGNVSEIARNFFGYGSWYTAEDLAFISGNSIHPFVVDQYEQWLKSKPHFERFGYHVLDMFYWEEKMSNWGAKMKTEAAALSRDVISPMNSRALLKTLLSVNRKYRDSHFNKLYDEIIRELSDGNKAAIDLPINPDKKQDMIRTMKKYRLYNLYRRLGIKTRKLKV